MGSDRVTIRVYKPLSASLSGNVLKISPSHRGPEAVVGVIISIITRQILIRTAQMPVNRKQLITIKAYTFKEAGQVLAPIRHVTKVC